MMKSKSKIKQTIIYIICILVFLCSFASASIPANAADIRILPFTSPLDYSLEDNWLYDGVGDDRAVDVFIVAPTVDTLNETNAVMTAEYKKRFRNAMNQQQALYAETARLYAPYYRQMAMNAYTHDPISQEEAAANAYIDVSSAFRYYLNNKNGGRPVILAGYSQGADMCYRLLQEFYGGDGNEAAHLRKNLVAVYAIGWPMTAEMVEKYPQIVPATREDDLGVVISYDCEDGHVKGTFIIPEGTKAISINPLNWRTDSVVASKKLNKGSVTQDSKTGAITSVTPHMCGAYIDPVRGSLIVQDINTTDYPPVLDIFPEGSYHLYDNFLFFVNLKENIQLRTNRFLEKRNITDKSA
ncbi:MAG: DUF3089 domain-containing protein [Butyrivibrio sp.]|nr:DUF3089 domain-containing protein [Butyrivibrio sp.]